MFLNTSRNPSTPMYEEVVWPHLEELFKKRCVNTEVFKEEHEIRVMMAMEWEEVFKKLNPVVIDWEENKIRGVSAKYLRMP